MTVQAVDFRPALTLAALALLFLLGGCATGRPALPVAVNPRDAHSYTMFDGSTGAPLTWEELERRVLRSDVIFVGELHTDPGAHALQQAIVELVMSAKRGSAVSLEMLERDEQPMVDAWLRRETTTEEFAQATGSLAWSGEGSWMVWYQPMLDSAREAEGTVIAANAPRRLIRRARAEGLAAISMLDERDRALIEIPSASLANRPYHDRFLQLMTEMADESEGVAPDLLAIDRAFRSQTSWDATMGASVAQAREEGAPSVVHIVGAFHVRFDGGTVSEVKMRRPIDRILVVVAEPSDSTTLRDEDRGAGDIVVYTPRAAR
ncbi:MAG: hypothetical protein EXS00_05575 [Phycisphaerales bacterium]|nr:hypothetical protein [Phycisphaerales bacterium]